MLLLLFVSTVWCKSDAIELMYNIVRNVTIPIDSGDDDVGCVRGFFAKGGALYLSYGGLSASKFVKLTVTNETKVKKSEIIAGPKVDARGATWCSKDETIYQFDAAGRKVLRYSEAADGRLIEEDEPDATDLANIIGVACKENQFVVSNASSTLMYLDDEFAVEREVEANDTKRRGEQLTELEWIYDKIWANAEKDDTLRAYDAQTGFVVYSLDVTALNLVANATCSGHCPKARANGIAFDSVTKKFYVTGLCWSHIYELYVYDPKRVNRDIFVEPPTDHFWTKEISDDTILGFAVGVGVCFCVSIVIYSVYACFGKKKAISWEKLEEDLAKMGN